MRSRPGWFRVRLERLVVRGSAGRAAIWTSHVVAAAKAAFIHDRIMALEGGYERLSARK